MCDATHLTLWAESVENPALHRCDACPWPLSAVICHTREVGPIWLCGHCAEQMRRQSALALLLDAALRCLRA